MIYVMQNQMRDLMMIQRTYGSNVPHMYTIHLYRQIGRDHLISGILKDIQIEFFFGIII